MVAANELLYNASLERSLLGAIIYTPSELDKFEILPDSTIFYYPGNRSVYEAIVGLYETEKPVEEEYIKSALLRKGEFDEISFLDILASSSVSKLKVCVDELKELEKKRKIMMLGMELKGKVESNADSGEMLDLLERKLFDMTEEHDSKGFVEIGSALDLADKHIKTMMESSDELMGIDTGFEKLNSLTSGFCGGDLVILAARPGMGKTSMALKMMLKTSSKENGVAVLSLEMPQEQLALRMLSMETGVDLKDLRNGNLNKDHLRALQKVKEDISSRNIYIDDTPSLRFRNIRSKIRRIVTKNKSIKLVIIDYLQLIETDNRQERHLQIAELSRGLKLLARELNIVIMALSQLNRTLESRPNKRPILSDIRESGSIEQDADIILFIYSEDVYRKQEEEEKEKRYRDKGIEYKSKYKEQNIIESELIIGKQRNGPLSTVILEFVKNLTLFRER